MRAFHSHVKAGKGWIEVARAAFSFVYWCDFGLTFWAIRNGVWLDSADLFFIPYVGFLGYLIIRIALFPAFLWFYWWRVRALTAFTALYFIITIRNVYMALNP
jgi:hypothetical protein